MHANFKPYYKDKIKVDGKICEVAPEIASAFNQLGWNEAYQERKRRKAVKGRKGDAGGGDNGFDPKASSRECSWDAMTEAGAEPGRDEGTGGLEETVIDRMMKEARIGILFSLILDLNEEEKSLLITITDGISSRQYEERYGVPNRTMLYRRERLLEALRGKIESEEKRGDTLRWAGKAFGDVRSLLGCSCQAG